MEVEQKPFTKRKPQQLVYLELGAANGGMLLSISEDGFRFRAVSPVRGDGPIPFAFSLDGTTRLEGTGEIESLEDDGKSGGLRFSEVSSEFRANLASWLSSDSSFNSTGREVTPAEATPLDSMEKIREDLHAGGVATPRQSQPLAPPSNPVSIDVSARNSANVVREETYSAALANDEIPVATPLPTPSEAPAASIENRTRITEKAFKPAPVSDKRAVPAISDRKGPERAISNGPKSGRNIPDKNHPPRLVVERPLAERPVTEMPAAQLPVSKLIVAKPLIPERPVVSNTASHSAAAERPKGMPVFSERLPDPKATPDTASRLFPHPIASPPETEKPAALASAFLRLAHETKAPGNTPTAPATAVVSVPPVPRVNNTVPTAFAAPPIALAPEENPLPAQPRRYVPALDVSLDLAWEQAKQSSPEPPHLSRTAASGIILIALTLILGALGFNFRQEIGAIFVQLGQRISGENGAVAPGPSESGQSTPENQQGNIQNIAPTSRPTESRPQSTPANSENAAKTFSKPVKTNEATTARSGENGGAKSGAITSDNANSAGSTVVPEAAKPDEKPPEILRREKPTEAVEKNGTAAGEVTGQEEFEAARQILRGRSRGEDLSRAVALMWSAVKKGNVPAEVTLGDLYRRGDGVVKNCDQARVLLVAASRKGSADARQQLEQMAEKGCE